jgi:tRNA threonylcarbamoyl adenosine modification protein YeaZ
VILVIDTSSSLVAVATIDTDGLSEVLLPARSQDLIPHLRQIAERERIDRVAVATGPGSFTGLRIGVSFGVGLAMGRGIPIVPLPTLQLQSARGRGELTAVSEAGRGRFYYLAPGEEATSGAPDEIPRQHPLVGLLSDASKKVLADRGLEIAGDQEVLSFAEAAAELLKSVREVPYESVKLEYMQSFGVRA